MKQQNVDVAIIGTGTAGMSAYRAALRHTDSIALIESGQYGTTCARVGCMPSKLLIAAADAAHSVREAQQFGVDAALLRVDGVAVMNRVRSERDRFVGHVLGAVESWDAEHRVRGTAHLLDDHRIAIGDDLILTADRIVIATGSRPNVPPAWADNLGDRLIVNDDVFDWEDLPRSVAVVGAGVIGLELAQALSRLGVRVRLFGRAGQVGPLTDPDLKRVAATIFADEYPFHPDAAIELLTRDGDEVVVDWSDGGLPQSERFDFVLAATGRVPNTDRLGLENTQLPLNARGIPHYDRTTGQIGSSHVFIAGDAANDLPLLHEAADEGKIAGDNAGRFPDVRVHPRRALLSVVFCDPQIALVGATYAQLTAANTAFASGAVSFDDQGRARVIGKGKGLLHVYGERGTGRFLGAEMVGPAAEHLAHLLAWALHSGQTVQAMLDSPFYHPVIEEGVRTSLRQLDRALQMGPVPIEHCLDCGPGA